MIEETAEKFKTLKLHSPNGEPLYLRRAFIMSAMSAGNNRGKYTSVAVDEGYRTATYDVKETLAEIPGPFADIGWLKLNPAYVATVGRNEEDSAGKSPYAIQMRAPELHGFDTATKPDVIMAAIDKALSQGPC